MPGEEEEEDEEEEECSLSGDEKTCLIGILILSLFSLLPLFSLLLLPRWSRIRKDSHFLLEKEEEEVCLDKQLHSVYLFIVVRRRSQITPNIRGNIQMSFLAPLFLSAPGFNRGNGNRCPFSHVPSFDETPIVFPSILEKLTRRRHSFTFHTGGLISRLRVPNK